MAPRRCVLGNREQTAPYREPVAIPLMTNRDQFRVWLSVSLAGILALASLTACSSSEPTKPYVPPGAPASIRFAGGVGQRDTALALSSTPLTVEVRDAGGRLVQVAPVAFTALDGSAGISFCSSTSVDSCSLLANPDSTFAGTASIFVRFGQLAGTARIAATVPGTGLADTTTLTISPASPVRIVLSPADSTAYTGNSYRVIGRVLDQYDNVRSGDRVTFAEVGSAATMGTDGVFHAQTVGRAFALVRSGALADTAWITVPPRGAIAVVDALSPNGPMLAKVALDGSGYAQLAPLGDSYGDAEPDWISPSEIAFSGGEGRILVVDTLGAIRRLTSAETPTIAERHAAGAPGGVVYFDAFGADYGTSLWKSSAPGTTPVRIGPNPPSNANAWQSTPSPDGQQLAYIDVGRSGLCTMIIATGEVTPLVIDAQSPRWSPLGQWIVFGMAGTLHMVHPDGSGLTDVAGARPFQSRADWSPDGAWLVVRSSARVELIEMSSGAILPLGWSAGLILPVFRH